MKKIFTLIAAALICSMTVTAQDDRDEFDNNYVLDFEGSWYNNYPCVLDENFNTTVGMYIEKRSDEFDPYAMMISTLCTGSGSINCTLQAEDNKIVIPEGTTTGSKYGRKIARSYDPNTDEYKGDVEITFSDDRKTATTTEFYIYGSTDNVCYAHGVSTLTFLNENGQAERTLNGEMTGSSYTTADNTTFKKDSTWYEGSGVGTDISRWKYTYYQYYTLKEYEAGYIMAAFGNRNVFFSVNEDGSLKILGGKYDEATTGHTYYYVKSTSRKSADKAVYYEKGSKFTETENEITIEVPFEYWTTYDASAATEKCTLVWTGKKEDPTGIESLKGLNGSKGSKGLNGVEDGKFVKDGQMVIRHNGKNYSVIGAEI